MFTHFISAYTNKPLIDTHFPFNIYAEGGSFCVEFVFSGTSVSSVSALEEGTGSES